MNDQSRYIVDSRYFDGTCLTFMTDGFRSDFGGETLEEMRVRENNPYLTSVTRQRIDKMLHLTFRHCPHRSVKSQKKNTMT